MDQDTILWTDYVKYRCRLRGFDLAKVEQIIRYSSERYVDTATGRLVVVGGHDSRLVLIPYERAGDRLTPVTIHTTSRQQVNFRIRSGRFTDE